MTVRLILVNLCLVVIGMIFPGQSFARIEPTTCVGAWLFDEETDVIKDVSGNGNNGIIKGKPKWDESKFGKAIALDGVDDYVDCGIHESLDVGKEDFSVVAWLKCPKYTPESWAGCVISRFDTNVPRHGYLFGVRGVLDANNKEKPLFLLGLGQASGTHLFGTETINDDVWHHIAATADRDGAAVFYRDGNLESQVNIKAFANENENNVLHLNIGADSGNRWFLKALIDEVAIFKTILDAEDIDSIMSKGLERSLGITAVSPLSKMTITWASIKAPDY